jgi:hypothetical protein
MTEPEILHGNLLLDAALLLELERASRKLDRLSRILERLAMLAKLGMRMAAVVIETSKRRPVGACGRRGIRLCAQLRSEPRIRLLLIEDGRDIGNAARGSDKGLRAGSRCCKDQQARKARSFTCNGGNNTTSAGN